MICPICKEVDHEPTAKYCHVCGTILVSIDNEAQKQIKHRIEVKKQTQVVITTRPHFETSAGGIVRIICVNMKPHEYDLKGVNVTTSNGVWRLGDQRNFRMPDCDVTIEAVLEKK